MVHKKRSKLILAAAVLAAIFGFAMFLHISNIRGPFTAPIVEFGTQIVILVFVGVVINLLGFITRNRIIVIIATVIYGLSALCVFNALRLFTSGFLRQEVGFWRLFTSVLTWNQIVFWFVRYSLPIFPSIILCIAGLVLQKKQGARTLS